MANNATLQERAAAIAQHERATFDYKEQFRIAFQHDSSSVVRERAFNRRTNSTAAAAPPPANWMKPTRPSERPAGKRAAPEGQGSRSYALSLSITASGGSTASTNESSSESSAFSEPITQYAGEETDSQSCTLSLSSDDDDPLASDGAATPKGTPTHDEARGGEAGSRAASSATLLHSNDSDKKNDDKNNDGATPDHAPEQPDRPDTDDDDEYHRFRATSLAEPSLIVAEEFTVSETVEPAPIPRATTTTTTTTTTTNDTALSTAETIRSLATEQLLRSDKREEEQG